MTGNIVALVDGSIYSASVCEHAAWVATKTGAPLELVHVLAPREAPERQDLSGSIRLGARSALLEELAELDAQRARLVGHRGRAILEDAQKIAEGAGISGVSTRMRHGDVVDTLAGIENDAALIVVGKRGEAADFAKGHLGSNLERIVRAAHKPVMVAARSFQPVSKVLVAYDGGVSAMKAVDQIARTPLFIGLPVTIVMVGAESPASHKSLADAAALIKAAGLAVETRLLAGQPEAVLGKLVEDEGFSLLVMGAYGHSRIRTLIIGSTTTELIRSCKVPVLLVR